jgi:hypothetical protein
VKLNKESLYGEIHNDNGNTYWIDGQYVEWNPELQELADRYEPMKVDWQEVRRPHAKFATCPRCGGDENLYGEDGIRNDFCGRCGQRIVWE